MTIRRVFSVAWRTLWLHSLRSLLAVLGIVFGVASVVAMLAIGEGVSQEAQARIERMGSRNILLDSVAPPSTEQASEARSRVSEFGLLRADLPRIRETVPGIVRVVPRRDAPEPARYGPRKFKAVVVGTEPAYAAVGLVEIEEGRFLSPADLRERRSVCVLGSEVAKRLFRSVYPIDRTIWAGEHAYNVVGVLEPRGEGTSASGQTTDISIFVPLTTMEERYGDIISDRATSGSFSWQRVQLHRIVVETASLDDVPRVASVLRALMQKWHPKEDVRLTVPLELLREARDSKRMFTIALAFIGGISLLVGGIGIMNIMLASVMERTREVGVRRALGAKKRDIVVQFLAETVLLSVLGGALGLGLGLLIPAAISQVFAVRTVVTPFSLALAFGISAAVGVIFGLYPAARAADLDPVEALRRE